MQMATQQTFGQSGRRKEIAIFFQKVVDFAGFDGKQKDLCDK
jgi:hypothetical protein